MSENNVDHFSFMIDYRAHLDPPPPEICFDNCVVTCLVTAKTATNS